MTYELKVRWGILSDFLRTLKILNTDFISFCKFVLRNYSPLDYFPRTSSIISCQILSWKICKNYRVQIDGKIIVVPPRFCLQFNHLIKSCHIFEESITKICSYLATIFALESSKIHKNLQIEIRIFKKISENTSKATNFWDLF